MRPPGRVATRLRRASLLLVCAAALGCQGLRTRPADRAVRDLGRLALHPFVNKTQQAALEDQLLTRVRDEFLRDGLIPIVPESDADLVLKVTITRYLNTPIQYDAKMSPTAYKLDILADVEVTDPKRPQQAPWGEKDMEGVEIYPASNLTGGMGEDQARQAVWDVMARDIVARVSAGPGAPAAPAPAASAPVPGHAPER